MNTAKCEATQTRLFFRQIFRRPSVKTDPTEPARRSIVKLAQLETASRLNRSSTGQPMGVCNTDGGLEQELLLR